jgi:hypothetical protein
MPTGSSFGEETSMPAATESKPSSTSNPLIVDLGKKNRKQIKQLRKGRGKLFDKVNSTLAELKTASTISANAEPVVVIVREKKRKPRGRLLPRC